MKTIAASEAKQHFGRLLQAAMAGPVLIEKSGNPAAVMLSVEEYEYLLRLQDVVLGEKALLAEMKGYLSAEETANAIARLNARHADA